jgi:hypothetical protein
VANHNDLPESIEAVEKDYSKLTRTWRWGVNRWFVIAFIVMGFFAARAYPPILPHIQLPAEVLSEQPLFSLPVLGDFYLTNTLVATFLADCSDLDCPAVRRAAGGDCPEGTPRGEAILKRSTT